MICYVDCCTKVLKNKLAVSHHIKMSAINCPKHRQYLEDLCKKIVEDFKDISISTNEIAQKYNVGLSYVLLSLRSKLTEEKIKQRQSNRLHALNKEKKQKKSRQIFCKNCNKSIFIRLNEERIFCHKKCYREYSKKYGCQVKKTKEELKELADKRHPKCKIICLKCGVDKDVTVFQRVQTQRTANENKNNCSISRYR